ncbi:MAG: hypothetical protein ACE5WD_05140 [Candidatus Aminicenantia bacterium]
MKSKVIKLIIIAIVPLLMMSSFKTEEDISYIWQGTIVVRQINVTLGGTQFTEWNLNVKWKETRKNDIWNENGRLVGQLIKLEDAGSSWQGKTSGPDGIGSGEGEGPIISAGWIYYSLSEKDPLKGVLPNGSYAFGSGSGQTQKIQVTGSKLPFYLGYYVSKYYIFQPFGQLGQNLPGPTRAESIKSYIQSTLSRLSTLERTQATLLWDTEKRVLKDGKMQGSFRYTLKHRWGSITNEVEWNISKVLNVECTIKKPDKNWRPKGGEEKNIVEITARIDNNENLTGKWRFTLFEVSHEKGYAMNKGSGDDLDLEFQEGQSDFSTPKKTNDGWVIESTKSANSITVKVQSLDYGAWGKIKAEVNIEGRWYECRAEDGKSYITIPYDDDEDHIADMWEEYFGVKDQSEETDDDEEPQSRQNGDGFTNYEEYRGFFVNESWREWYFSPRRKDLFIYDEIGMGVAYFTETQIMIHLIDKDEYDDNRVVNFNRGYGTLKSQEGQKGLYLHEEELIGLWGEVKPCVGTPNVVEEVVVNSISLEAKSAYAKWGTEGKLLQNYASAIAHELGHGVNILHHGDDLWEALHDYKIARSGGLWSGDIACVMRYSPPDSYLGRDGNIYPYPEEEEGPRSMTSFCSSPTGTGINAPGERIGPNGNPYPVAGDAEKGNCRNNITLKGYNKWGE